MNKKMKTTYDEHLESMSAERRKEFDRTFRSMALSEMVYAAMANDIEAVRKLAQLAGVSPTIINDLRSGKKGVSGLSDIFKVIESLGFTVHLEKGGEVTPVHMLRVLKTYTS